MENNYLHHNTKELLELAQKIYNLSKTLDKKNKYSAKTYRFFRDTAISVENCVHQIDNINSLLSGRITEENFLWYEELMRE